MNAVPVNKSARFTFDGTCTTVQISNTRIPKLLYPVETAVDMHET